MTGWRYRLEELFWCSHCYLMCRYCGDTRREALRMSLRCRWLVNR